MATGDYTFCTQAGNVPQEQNSNASCSPRDALTKAVSIRPCSDKVHSTTFMSDFVQTYNDIQMGDRISKFLQPNELRKDDHVVL